jgi:hypothetical protein
MIMFRAASVLADHVGSPVRLLIGEESRGRHRAGEDMLFADVDPHASQFHRDVAASALAVVGQEHEGDVFALKLFNETFCARN